MSLGHQKIDFRLQDYELHPSRMNVSKGDSVIPHPCLMPSCAGGRYGEACTINIM